LITHTYLPKKLHIIAISETKLNANSNLSLIQLPGYSFIHADSTSCAGGVGIYIESTISYHANLELHLSMATGKIYGWK